MTAADNSRRRLHLNELFRQILVAARKRAGLTQEEAISGEYTKTQGALAQLESPNSTRQKRAIEISFIDAAALASEYGESLDGWAGQLGIPTGVYRPKDVADLRLHEIYRALATDPDDDWRERTIQHLHLIVLKRAGTPEAK